MHSVYRAGYADECTKNELYNFCALLIIKKHIFSFLLSIFTIISLYFYEKWILTEHSTKCYNKIKYVNNTVSR